MIINVQVNEGIASSKKITASTKSSSTEHDLLFSVNCDVRKMCILKFYLVVYVDHIGSLE